jgi:hypothetical protein
MLSIATETLADCFLNFARGIHRLMTLMHLAFGVNLGAGLGKLPGFLLQPNLQSLLF